MQLWQCNKKLCLRISLRRTVFGPIIYLMSARVRNTLFTNIFEN